MPCTWSTGSGDREVEVNEKRIKLTSGDSESPEYPALCPGEAGKEETPAVCLGRESDGGGSLHSDGRLGVGDGHREGISKRKLTSYSQVL